MCQAAVEGSLGRVPGVISYTVTLSTDSAVIVYDPGWVSAAQIAQATAAIGYKARQVEEIMGEMP